MLQPRGLPESCAHRSLRVAPAGGGVRRARGAHGGGHDPRLRERRAHAVPAPGPALPGIPPGRAGARAHRRARRGEPGLPGVFCFTAFQLVSGVQSTLSTSVSGALGYFFLSAERCSAIFFSLQAQRSPNCKGQQPKTQGHFRQFTWCLRASGEDPARCSPLRSR